jgi:uncharacterized protein YndB with AHSA1/START domain
MSLRFERDLPFPRDAVWHALTDRRALEQWWLEADFEPEVGYCYALRDLPRGPWNGSVRGEVLAVESRALLRYSWSTAGLARPTFVTWRLAERGEGTGLVLTHDGFRGALGRLAAAAHCVGWGRYLRRALPAAADLFARRGPRAAFGTPPRHVRVGARLRAT